MLNLVIRIGNCICTAIRFNEYLAEVVGVCAIFEPAFSHSFAVEEWSSSRLFHGGMTIQFTGHFLSIPYSHEYKVRLIKKGTLDYKVQSKIWFCCIRYARL